MKLAFRLLPLSVLLAPAAAFACPAGAGADGASSCGGSVLGYVAAIAIGLTVGAGSVLVERKLRK